MGITGNEIAIIIGSVAATSPFLAVSRQENANRAKKSQDEKREIYEQLITASENLREAYFRGEPDSDSRNLADATIDFRLASGGWSRPSPWLNPTEDYRKQLGNLNAALAGIALYAPKEIAKKAFDMETYAIDFRNSPDRKKYMNELLSMMLKDTGEVETVRDLDWY